MVHADYDAKAPICYQRLWLHRRRRFLLCKTFLSRPERIRHSSRIRFRIWGRHPPIAIVTGQDQDEETGPMGIINQRHRAPWVVNQLSINQCPLQGEVIHLSRPIFPKLKAPTAARPSCIPNDCFLESS